MTKVPQIGDRAIYRCQRCKAIYTGEFRASPEEFQQQTGIRQCCYLIDKNGELLTSLACGHSNIDLKRIK